MSLLQAVILGVLQGITEFLPVSSSGHLVLIPGMLGWPDPGICYDAVVHLGTFVAVAVYFWRDIIALLVAWWESVRTRKVATTEARVAWTIIIGTIPGAIMGALLEDSFERLFGSPGTVSILLLATGVLLFVGETVGRQKRQMASLGLWDAVVLGIAQGCAIAPGISRSGATISAGLLRGLDRGTAARFSFLLGIPLVAGAAGMQVLGVLTERQGTVDWALLVVGFAVALVSGYGAIRFLLGYVGRHGLRPFAYYCWALGLVGLVVFV